MAPGMLLSRQIHRVLDKNLEGMLFGEFYEKKTAWVLPNRTADRRGHHSYYGRHRCSELSKVTTGGERSFRRTVGTHHQHVCDYLLQHVPERRLSAVPGCPRGRTTVLGVVYLSLLARRSSQRRHQRRLHLRVHRRRQHPVGFLLHRGDPDDSRYVGSTPVLLRPDQRDSLRAQRRRLHERKQPNSITFPIEFPVRFA